MTVSGRKTWVNIWSRVSSTRTDRSSCSAASTARNNWYCGRRPEPKPPPTKGDTTRTSSFASPNTLVTYWRLLPTPWILSWTVMRPSPSQITVVACGSIGWWNSAATVNSPPTLMSAA